MGYPVFSGHATVFFVGGNGDQSGRTPCAGGCTRTWWDSQCPNNTDAEKTAAINKLMMDGAPMVDQPGCAFTGSNNRITRAGGFAHVEPGMVAYVVETPTPGEHLTTMRYLITNVDPAADWIEIGEATGDDATVTVTVGGAFDTLQDALDETAAGSHSVCIFTNLSETLAGSVEVDAGPGDVMRNTFKCVAGYHTVPGDMGRNGAWYESPLDILQNGAIDPARCVTLDANGAGYAAIAFNAANNIVFENVFMRRTGGQAAMHFATVCRNIVFRNCRFAEVLCAINSEADHVLFDRCYSHDDIASHQYIIRGHNNTLLGCVGRAVAGTNLCNIVGKAAVVIGCIMVGGQFAVRIVNAGAYATVLNNTFVDTLADGVLLDGGDGTVVANNIFCLAPAAVGICVRNGGSITHNDHNCFIESDGTPLVPTGNVYAGGEMPAVGAHSVGTDPDFANAAGYDLRPRYPAVLRGGAPAPDGRAAVIGAIGQEYAFHHRARMTSAGRMTILK